MARLLLRSGWFVGIAYLVNDNLSDVWKWLAIATVVTGMDFVWQTVRQWDAEEQARRD